MARVTITIEDLPNGKVKIVADPSFEILTKITVNFSDLTSAQGYAIFALNQIRMASKAGNINISVPKARRGMN